MKYGPISNDVEALVKATLEDLIRKYSLRSVPAINNETRTWTGNIEDVNIKISSFPGHSGFTEPWIHASVGFGEIRYSKAWNACMGEKGMRGAASHYENPFRRSPGGTAIKGYDIIGFKWRLFSPIAPKSRTSAGEDEYIITGDIIEELCKFRSIAEKSKDSPRSPSFNGQMWANARPGWANLHPEMKKNEHPNFYFIEVREEN